MLGVLLAGRAILGECELLNGVQFVARSDVVKALTYATA